MLLARRLGGRHGCRHARAKSTLLERLDEGPVLCGEGYLFEMERRGYVQAGAFVPEVVLENPDAVAQLHRDFLRCGSDVMLAFTYYAHREKLRLLGKEEQLESMNRQAIRIAKDVASEGDALVAGGICNSNLYVPFLKDTHNECRAMFEEQVGWAADEGVDFIVGETFNHTGEAMLALEAIKAAGQTAVINLVVHKGGVMLDGDTPADALLKLKDAGADVVGLNCGRGPDTMLPVLEDICGIVPGPISALPVAYRTSDECPTFQGLCCPTRLYTDMEQMTCSRYEMAEFATKAHELGVSFLGVCCGGAPHHIRSMAEALGKLSLIHI